MDCGVSALLTRFGKITQYTTLGIFGSLIGPTGAYPVKWRRTKAPPWKERLLIENQGRFPVNNVASKGNEIMSSFETNILRTPKIHQSIQISLRCWSRRCDSFWRKLCRPCPLFWFVKNVKVRVSQMYCFSSRNNQMLKETCWLVMNFVDVGRLGAGHHWSQWITFSRWIRKIGTSTWVALVDEGFLPEELKFPEIRDFWKINNQPPLFSATTSPVFCWNWIFVWASNRLKPCYECEQLKWFAACGLASRFQLRHDLERLYCGDRCLGVVVCWSVKIWRSFLNFHMHL